MMSRIEKKIKVNYQACIPKSRKSITYTPLGPGRGKKEFLPSTAILTHAVAGLWMEAMLNTLNSLKDHLGCCWKYDFVRCENIFYER